MGFGELLISEPVQQTLQRAVRTQQLPPAYMFVGPVGVGKRSTALTLAKALNCLARHGDACDECASCLRIDRQLHPDIHCLEPQGQVIKIDQIRQLREALTLQAYEGRMKVAILDEAETLTIEAGNALLKMLEEPPAQTLFVLIGQHLGGLPATVRSRVQVLHFGLAAHDQLVGFLQRHGYEAEAAERALCLSGERLGAALALDLGATLERRAEAWQLLTQAQAGDTAVLLASAEQWAKRKNDHEPFFEMLLSLIRDLAVSRLGGDEGLLIHRDLAGKLSSLAAALPFDMIWDIFELVHSTQQAIAHNANPQLALEVMLFKIGDVYERARQ